MAQEDCNLTLIDVDQAGSGQIIFPNAFQRDNRLKARQAFQFPGPSASFQFRLADPGVETVTALCNASRPVTRGFEPDPAARGFTQIGNYADRLARQIAAESTQRSRTRQIRVEAADGAVAGATPLRPPAASGGQPAPALATSAPSEIVGRAAIRLRVN